MRWIVFLSGALLCCHATSTVAGEVQSSGIGTVDALVLAQTAPAQPADADTAAAIIAVGTEIDDAFARVDKAALKALLIPGHISVTPYYDGPQSVDDQIASLSDFKDYEQTIVGAPSVQMLSPDVGLKFFVAELKGSFKGVPLPARIFVGQIMVKRGEKWIGGFYQVTTLKP